MHQQKAVRLIPNAHTFGDARADLQEMSFFSTILDNKSLCEIVYNVLIVSLMTKSNIVGIYALDEDKMYDNPGDCMVICRASWCNLYTHCVV